MTLKILTAAVCALFAATSVEAQSQGSSGFVPGAVFLVTHAQRGDLGRPEQLDPGLSEAGRARAVSLATVLKDAEIATIFVTGSKRTRETAAPLANSLGIVPAPFADTTELVAKLRRTVGNSLVVGERETLRQVTGALGVRMRRSLDDDSDELFVVTPGSTGLPTPRLILLHYR